MSLATRAQNYCDTVWVVDRNMEGGMDENVRAVTEMYEAKRRTPNPPRARVIIAILLVLLIAVIALAAWMALTVGPLP